MTPREIIAKCLPSHPAIDRGQWADEILTSLAFSGYRILGPGEWDPETVEKCAEEVELFAAIAPYVPPTDAIRALAKEKKGC